MMNNYKYPSLNGAIAVSAKPECLYILQDMAPYDLHGLMRSLQLRNETGLSTFQIRNILYRVAKGISYLHSKGLVHGDIKCSNILYFSDSDIRITDFNLTTLKKWKSNIHLCTAIYRPYEIWASKDWTEKIDIWSYGCMMFELFYEKLLFPFQGKFDDKRTIKHRYINAIADWSNFNKSNKLKISKYNISYKKPNIPSDLCEYSSGEKPFDYNKNNYINLMLKCLQVLDRDRPHIDTILGDSYFIEMR
ncbi:MAG TPA: protein kinase, partial [Aquella sp.]|nr:protein kinase [Aquella sp.]